MTDVSDSITAPEAIEFGPAVDVTHHSDAPKVLVVCEHASARIPAAFDQLGLDAEAAQSHAAWDPGALGVAKRMAERLSAVLVAGQVSRLVYDCNRPPDAQSAIPERSEVFQIPGNQNLTAAQWASRVEGVYVPFQTALSGEVEQHRKTLNLMVTVHSFTPVFNGQPRSVELGILHGEDDNIARAMMEHLPDPQDYDIRLNEPYSATDGVAHTLDLHGAQNGLPNVMIEIRNDLIQTEQDQRQMADYLADWVTATLTHGAAE